MTKSGAVKAAMDAGVESLEEIADFAKKTFGLDIAKPHISAEKSRLKGKNAVTVTARAERGGLPGEAAGANRGRKPEAAVEGYLAPPPKPRSENGGSDLLAEMEVIKPLVESMGKERAHRIIDLLA
jgi:hypothetical protein